MPLTYQWYFIEDKHDSDENTQINEVFDILPLRG